MMVATGPAEAKVDPAGPAEVPVTLTPLGPPNYPTKEG
jgi:hypothetical protein